VLAEDQGVLDQLEAKGFEIRGPVWRSDRVSPVAAPPSPEG
jgi:hypothetical protein